jgi:PAS domain S-box-containing protein
MAGERIMVVEDEPIVAADIRETLEMLGYVIPAIASSGEEAIQKAMETQPDLILMDIKLQGGMDGVEVAACLQDRLETPVIYLTAYADTETLQRAKITEPFGYILKPFAERELHTAIELALYRHQMERKLQENTAWLAATLRSLGNAVVATDMEGCVTFMNPLAETLTGWTQEEAWGREVTEVCQIITLTENPVKRALREGVVVGIEENTVLIAKDGTKVPIQESATLIRDDNGHLLGAALLFQDISLRKQAEEERLKLILTLQDALSKIKTLSGLLPICASCKKIRDAQGDWKSIEVYIQERSEAKFSHAICPDCKKKLYPELSRD